MTPMSPTYASTDLSSALRNSPPSDRPPPRMHFFRITAFLPIIVVSPLTVLSLVKDVISSSKRRVSASKGFLFTNITSM